MVGLVCGFQVANYNYRSEMMASKNAAAVSAAAGAGQSQPSNAEVMAIIERARNNPQDFEAQHAAAEQFIQIQRPEGALEFLTKAQHLKPDDPDTLAELAEANYLLQRFDESIKWAKRALAVQSPDPRSTHKLMANFYLMVSYVETGQNLDEAERLLAQLEELRPGDRTLAEVREAIAKSRAESVRGKAKTTLSHGPEEAPGGRR